MDSLEIKKVIIVGNGESRNEAPYSDASFDVWAASSVQDLPRYDAIFELHKGYTNSEEGVARRNFVTNAKCLVYMQKTHKGLPNSVIYPIKEIIKKYGNYLTNTISYMIALALMLEYGEIHIYGVSMEHDTEYGRQRASCEYWVGLARGLGINIFIPQDSDLCKTYYLYGYEEHPMLKKFNKMKDFIKGKQNDAEDRFDYYEKLKHRYQGQQETLDYILNYFE